MSILKKKPFQAAMALVLVAIIALGATFAWQSFNQRKANEFEILVSPDANLHDDFDAPNKDVYVENSGKHTIYTRVKLSEYMEIAENSLLTGAIKTEPDTWEPHTFKTEGEDPNKKDICTTCGKVFHDYYSWMMGGQKYYKPATEEQKSAPEIKANDGTITPAREPVVVQDKWELYSKYTEDVTAKITEVGESTDQTILDKLTAKIAELKALPENIGKEDAEIRTMAVKAVSLAELGLKETQNAYVYSMTEWVNGTAEIKEGETVIRPAIAKLQKGSFWVLDVDGWAYWADQLKAGEATGLLLNQVDRTEKEPEGNAFYSIDVWLQAVTKDDMGQFGIAPNSITANAKNLLDLATGDFLIAEDGLKYKDNKDNTFNLVTVTDGVDTYGVVFCGGADQKPSGTSGDDIAVGENINAFNGTETAEYMIDGMQTGANGIGYFDVGEGRFAVSKDAADKIVPLGTGTKYELVYAGPDGIIGSKDDAPVTPWKTLEGKFFYHVGNGIYTEVASATSTNPIENALLYYTGGKDISGTDIATIDAAFEFNSSTATPGSPYALTVDAKEHSVVGIKQGINGQYYLVLAGDPVPYLGAGEDGGMLGATGAGNKVLYAGNDGEIGSRDDTETKPNKYAESFLPDTFTGEAGSTFTVDGNKWVVLNVDEYGNRLVTTTLVGQVGGKFATSQINSAQYEGSLYNTALNDYFKNSMPTLKPYAMKANIPVEVGMTIGNAATFKTSLSTCALTKDGATAFPISISDVNVYMTGDMAKYKIGEKTAGAGGTIWNTRSKFGPYVAGFNSTGNYYDPYPNTAYAGRPALFVRFSDADTKYKPLP